LEGSLSLPWKTADTFSGTIPNVAVVDWFLQDDTGEPIWTESAFVNLSPAGTIQVPLS